MKEIPLSQGKFALVDDEDFAQVSRFNWFYSTGYAVRNIKLDTNVYKMELMHRFLLGLNFGDGKIVDHKNGNGLDNRRENLRICSKLENQRNQGPRHTKTSKYKGVGYFKRDKKWRARIKVGEKDIEIGKFTTEKEAALAYNKAALKYFGEFAWLNDVN